MSPSKCLSLAIVACAMPLLASAQQASQEFQISNIEFALQESPNFSVSGYNKKVRKATPWLEVEVTFDWTPRLAEPKYLDDLVINYYILLSNKTKDFPQGALLVGTVNHVSVTQGKDLRSVAYVSPRTLEKMFDGKLPVNVGQTVAGVGVTLTSGGNVVAERSTSGRGQWWTTYQPTQGLVLNKMETPFAPIAWDYYEPVKSRSAGQ